MDPPGFYALESFDVMGGHSRAPLPRVSEKVPAVKGFGLNGQAFGAPPRPAGRFVRAFRLTADRSRTCAS